MRICFRLFHRTALWETTKSGHLAIPTLLMTTFLGKVWVPVHTALTRKTTLLPATNVPQNALIVNILLPLSLLRIRKPSASSRTSVCLDAGIHRTLDSLILQCRHNHGIWFGDIPRWSGYGEWLDVYNRKEDLCNGSWQKYNTRRLYEIFWP